MSDPNKPDNTKLSREEAKKRLAELRSELASANQELAGLYDELGTLQRNFAEQTQEVVSKLIMMTNQTNDSQVSDPRPSEPTSEPPQ